MRVTRESASVCVAMCMCVSSEWNAYAHTHTRVYVFKCVSSGYSVSRLCVVRGACGGTHT